jgi:hypothetical protein
MFQAGDHVYIGRGLTGTVKHHAIVVAAEDKAGWFQIVEYGVFNADGSKKLIAGHVLEVVKENGDVRRCRVNAKKEQWRLSSEQSDNSAQTPPASCGCDHVCAREQKLTSTLPHYLLQWRVCGTLVQGRHLLERPSQ